MSLRYLPTIAEAIELVEKINEIKLVDRYINQKAEIGHRRVYVFKDADEVRYEYSSFWLRCKGHGIRRCRELGKLDPEEMARLDTAS